MYVAFCHLDALVSFPIRVEAEVVIQMGHLYRIADDLIDLLEYHIHYIVAVDHAGVFHVFEKSLFVVSHQVLWCFFPEFFHVHPVAGVAVERVYGLP